VHNISDLANSSLGQSASAAEEIHDLERIAAELHELVTRFKRD